MVYPLYKSYEEVFAQESFKKVHKDICSYFLIFTNQISSKNAKELQNQLLKEAYGSIMENAGKENIKVIIISPQRHIEKNSKNQLARLIDK